MDKYHGCIAIPVAKAERLVGEAHDDGFDHITVEGRVVADVEDVLSALSSEDLIYELERRGLIEPDAAQAVRDELTGGARADSAYQRWKQGEAARESRAVMR